MFFKFDGDTDNIIFLSLGKKVMNVGQRYTITFLADDGDCNTINSTVTGEYRGLSQDEYYIIFWIDGDSKGTDLYLYNITAIKAAE